METSLNNVKSSYAQSYTHYPQNIKMLTYGCVSEMFMKMGIKNRVRNSRDSKIGSEYL